MITKIEFCPCTLQKGYSTYSPTGRLLLFGNRTKTINHTLTFGPPGKNTQLTKEYNEKRKSLSISGYQEKYTLKQVKNNLQLAESKGSHILKPIPAERFELVKDMPANEHLTMQIARQIFKIKTAECAIIFFNEGSPAYITKRFDFKKDGSKYQIEDFATLMGKSAEAEGNNYKYNASYLDMAKLIEQYIPAAKVELINFFRLVVFNYLIANGDAHLKNFSVMESDQGDYLLSPAYDLMCTSLHLNDTDICMRDGLFEGDYNEPDYQITGMHTRESFLSFADKINISRKISGNIIDDLTGKQTAVQTFIDQSFLSAEGKALYLRFYTDRQLRLCKNEKLNY